MILEVFDPPMCCSSGVCGPKVDPVLPRFAGDLEWVKSQGVAVKRYNLAQQPMAFADNEVVRKALTEDENCLPLVLVEGRIVSRAKYPTRAELAAWAGVSVGAGEKSTGEKKSSCCCEPRKKSGMKSKCCC